MDRLTLRGRDRGSRLGSLASLLVVAGLGIVSPGLVRAQGQAAVAQPSGGRPCPGGTVGSLGITGIDCRGDCTATLDDNWRKRAWSFSVEPRITEIAPNSPAARALQTGDWIVAIDGALITTREGGQRFANIEPDRSVTIRYRRQGRVGEARLHAVTRCAPALEGLSSAVSNSSPAVKTPGSTTTSSRDTAAVNPGMVIQRWATAEGQRTRITISPRPGNRPESGTGLGHLGLSIGCGPCSEIYEDGRMVHSFSGPVEVVGVELGGPADRAGFHVGDRISAVNGMRIQSKEGGRAFSTVRPGVKVRFTLVARDGRERTVTAVPD